MSQNNVERVIGLLATDEAVRQRFAKSPYHTLTEIANQGIQLTNSERQALASLDPFELARFARNIHCELQKSDLRGDVIEGDPK